MLSFCGIFFTLLNYDMTLSLISLDDSVSFSSSSSIESIDSPEEIKWDDVNEKLSLKIYFSNISKFSARSSYISQYFISTFFNSFKQLLFFLVLIYIFLLYTEVYKSYK